MLVPCMELDEIRVFERDGVLRKQAGLGFRKGAGRGMVFVTGKKNGFLLWGRRITGFIVFI